MTDAAGLALGQQEVEQAVLDETIVEGVHATIADAM